MEKINDKKYHYHPKLFFGKSKKMEKVRTMIDHVANTDITVLICGESGTGKELVAQSIYTCSNRANHPFVKVLCAAIPDSLLESELFGHEKGSFTGADHSRPGKFEFANHGTIFLDEIGDISYSHQAKLLQVLQDGEFSRLGGKEVKVDVRVVVATNKNLAEAVREGIFREDLFYRLNVVSICLPPLRKRKEDIPELTDLFTRMHGQHLNQGIQGISDNNLKLFMDYNWPGNVRELENLVKRMMVLGNQEVVVQNYFFEKREIETELRNESENGKNHNTSDWITPQSELIGIPLKKRAKDALRNAESDLIKRVLLENQWNRKKTAKLLGISYKSLLYKIKELEWNKEAS